MSDDEVVTSYIPPRYMWMQINMTVPLLSYKSYYFKKTFLLEMVFSHFEIYVPYIVLSLCVSNTQEAMIGPVFGFGCARPGVQFKNLYSKESNTGILLTA